MKKVKPVDERVQPDFNEKGPALVLTNDEREILRKKQLASQILILFVEQSKSMSDIIKELNLDRKVLTEFLYSPEYPLFREAVAERAAEMYLDLNRSWKGAEIAEALGMTMRQFRYFVRTETFLEKYRELFARLDDDPTPRSVQLKIIEHGLPKAYETLLDLLEPGVAASTRLNAAKLIIDISGIQGIKPSVNDRQEAAQFLASQTIENQTINNFNVPIPAEYAEAVKKYLPAVDGEYATVDQSHTPGSTPETDSAQ